MQGKSKPSPYTPNKIPTHELIQSALFVVGLAGYLVFSIYRGGIYLAGPRGIGMNYEGIAFFFIGTAMLFGIANLAANVIDHFDQRDNERKYVWFRFLTKFIGWSLMMVGLLTQLGV